MTPGDLAELLALRDTLRAMANRLDAVTKTGAPASSPSRHSAHVLTLLVCSGEGGRTHALSETAPETGTATIHVIPPRAAFPVIETLQTVRGERCAAWIRERGGFVGEVLVLWLFGSRNDGPLFGTEE